MARVRGRGDSKFGQPVPDDGAFTLERPVVRGAANGTKEVSAPQAPSSAASILAKFRTGWRAKLQDPPPKAPEKPPPEPKTEAPRQEAPRKEPRGPEPVRGNRVSLSASPFAWQSRSPSRKAKKKKEKEPEKRKTASPKKRRTPSPNRRQPSGSRSRFKPVQSRSSRRSRSGQRKAASRKRSPSRSRRKPTARAHSKSQSRSRKRAKRRKGYESKTRNRSKSGCSSSWSSRSCLRSPSKKRSKQKTKHKTSHGHKKLASRASADEGASLAERRRIEEEAEAQAQAQAARLAEEKAAEAWRLEEKAAAEGKAQAAAEPTAKAKVANEERAKQMSEGLANLGKGYEKNWEGKASEKKKKKKTKAKEDSEKEETKPREKRSKRSDEANTCEKHAKSTEGKEKSKSKKVTENEDKGKVETPAEPQSVPRGKPKVKAVKKNRSEVNNTKDPVEGKDSPKEVKTKTSKQEKAVTKKKVAEADTKEPKKDKNNKTHKDAKNKAKKVEEEEEAPKAKTFKCHAGQALQYLSSKYNAWVPCKVLAVDDAGAVQINLKPGYWFKDDELKAKLRLEDDASADPGAGRCGMCSKRVAKEAGGIGGVICRRKRDDESGFVGCGKGLCWKCMPQADETRFGKVRPRKEDVEELEKTTRKSFWWMHAACMTAVDTTDYAVQMMPPVPQ